MADKNKNSMAGMPGMSMGDTPRQGPNTDPTKNQKGMDTPAPPVQAAGEVRMPEAMKNMPMWAPRVWSVTGTEDWTMLRGFGQASGMVTMMNEMMVGGGPMGAMKMGKMDMSLAEMPAPTPEQARMASDTAPAPATMAPLPGGTQVTMTVASGTPQVGDNTLDIMVTDADGKPVTGLKLTATVAMTTMDMGTTHPPVMEMGGGHYMSKVTFAMAGPWRVALTGGAAQSMVFQTGVASPQAASQPRPASAPMAGGPLSITASIAPDPPAAGDGNTLTVTVTGAAGKPIPGATVTSTVAMTTMDMGTTHPAFRDIGGGRYQGKVGFGMAGPWRVSLHVAAPGQKPSVKDIVFNAK